MENTKDNLEQFRGALQREFIERSQKNPAYSLRAFARQLGIDQSFLSKVLKGNRQITPKLVATVGPKLGLKPTQVKSIFSGGTANMANFLSLADDEFDLLSIWYHFAIIELSKTDDFVNDAAWIASRLGIHVQEVRDAIERLERLGFVRQNDNNNLTVLTPNTTWTNTSSTSEARKKYQRNLIEKSLDAIDNVPFELRENGSLTIAINKNRMPEFKERLREMRKELSAFLQDGTENLDEVYQLTIALFPLSKVKGETP